MNNQHYSLEHWEELVNLWVLYSKHLAHIIKHIPQSKLLHTINIGTSGNFTFEFIIKDYLEHHKHHLNSLFPEADFLHNTFKMIY